MYAQTHTHAHTHRHTHTDYQVLFAYMGFNSRSCLDHTQHLHVQKPDVTIPCTKDKNNLQFSADAVLLREWLLIVSSAESAHTTISKKKLDG